jgi:recombination protein RecA
MGDHVVGLQARLMSQAMRKLAGAIRRSPTAVVFTNQIRLKIGVTWGSPETTPGGLALKFYAAVRVRLQKADSIKVGAEIIGSNIKARIVKNKVGAPFTTAEFTIMYNEGISRVGDLLSMGEKTGIIDRRGAFYSFEDTKIGQGKEAAKRYLSVNPELTDKIEEEIKEVLKS